jgi:mycothiol system anti-sigma-R factor
MSAMTCQQAVQQFFTYLDRALASEDLEDLQAHLDACLACCDRLAFSRELDAFVRARLPEAVMPAALEARVRRALGQSVGEGS